LKKKKVLFILHLPPPINGASTVGKYIIESKELNNTFDIDYINLATAFTLDSIGKASAKKITTSFRIFINTLKALLKSKYDLCYMSLNAKGSGFYKDLLIVTLLKIFRKKIIYHFHNRGIATMQHRWLNNLLYRYTFNNTKSILLSKLLYSDVAKYVNENNVFYCANGIPDLYEADSFNHKREQPEDKCQLLFFSNMMAQKGVYELIEACKILRNKGLYFECHFVGAWSDVSDKEMMNKLVLEQLSEVIFVHGKKYGNAKSKFFKTADIFVFPSHYHNECFPLVILEAMQFGLPVISTNIGGIPDMIRNGENGFLIPPKNIDMLVEKLEILINNSDLRQKMGRSSRVLYKSLYTIIKFEQNLKMILTTAMKD
jgi:glycosyltransferase involved in cell wall biosynthesis